MGLIYQKQSNIFFKKTKEHYLSILGLVVAFFSSGLGVGGGAISVPLLHSFFI
ncbi:MAG: hypothetical protein HQK49_20625 [Oligoflexia bacterium]|nr:hypothetical protein [Oligoflexia bacterium]